MFVMRKTMKAKPTSFIKLNSPPKADEQEYVIGFSC